LVSVSKVCFAPIVCFFILYAGVGLKSCFFAGGFVSHAADRLTSLVERTLLLVKFSPGWDFVPAPTVSHVWVNPSSRAFGFGWVRLHGFASGIVKRLGVERHRLREE
jgi:hypothetical protein